MDYDDDDDFEANVIFTLHALAWQASLGRIKGVPISIGTRLIDLLKSEEIDEIQALPYIVALHREDGPQWD